MATPHADLRSHAHHRLTIQNLETEAAKAEEEARRDWKRALELGANPTNAKREIDLFLDILAFALRSSTKAAQAFRIGQCENPPLGLPLSLRERQNDYRNRLADLVIRGRA